MPPHRLRVVPARLRRLPPNVKPSLDPPCPKAAQQTIGRPRCRRVFPKKTRPRSADVPPPLAACGYGNDGTSRTPPRRMDIGGPVRRSTIDPPRQRQLAVARRIAWGPCRSARLDRTVLAPTAPERPRPGLRLAGRPYARRTPANKGPGTEGSRPRGSDHKGPYGITVRRTR